MVSTDYIWQHVASAASAASAASFADVDITFSLTLPCNVFGKLKTMKLHRSLPAILVLVFSAAAFARPGVGDVAPDNVGTDLNGDNVSLATYAGKPIVISFWATWCPYCLQELPILEGIQKTAGSSKIQVIAVNTESREVFRKAARAMDKLALKVTHDTGKKGYEAFGVRGIPHMVIIGRDGKIVRVYSGYSESSLEGIVADINAALAAPN